MKLSIHREMRGKPEKRKDKFGKTRLWQNGKFVNLGWEWENIESDWDAIFDLITVDGVATAPYLTNENRCEANFVEHSIALIDIDDGMTIEQLFNDEFYNAFGGGFYTTPSHTDDDHRFRIIHRLETPITSHERMRKLYRGLMKKYGHADPVCKDSARLFFGTINCVLKEKRSEFLSNDAVDAIIEDIEASDALIIKESSIQNYSPLSDTRKKQVIDLLQSSYVGEYAIWRNIGWGLKAGGFSLADFQYITTGMMSQKSASDAAHIWKSSVRDEITMGTVMHFLHARYGKDCLKESESVIFFDKFGNSKIKSNIQI